MQFLGNSFNTKGGPMNFNHSSGTSGSEIYVCWKCGLQYPDDPLPTTVCDLPSLILSPYFTGRDKELQQVDHALRTSSSDLPARCVIHGMPGVGKTQLALRFASLAYQEGQHPYVFWVSGASDEKLTRDFCKLVDLVRPRGWSTLDQRAKITVARDWLENAEDVKSWLLVLDNVTQETTGMLLRDILPRRNSRGKLLMTTKTATVAEVLTGPGESFQLALQPLRVGDAVALLWKGAKMERKSGEDAKRLVRSIGNLPLAIDQAASYMRFSGSNPKEMLDQVTEVIGEKGRIFWGDCKLTGIQILTWENDYSSHEEKSVAAIFTPALRKIQQTAPDALILLQVLCFCDPDNIPISILQQGCGALHQKDGHGKSTVRGADKLEAVMDLFRSQIGLSKAIQHIQRLSLVACPDGGSDRTLRIHDLVHLLLREKLIADTERAEWLEIAVYIICHAFEEIWDAQPPQSWSRCYQFISHIASLEAFAEQYKLKSTELSEASTRAGLYLDVYGLYDKAVILHQRTWDQKKVVLGEEHPDTLTSMSSLGLTYGSQGRWKEAEELELQVLERRTRVLGEEHERTLTSMANVASLRCLQGRGKEAEELQVQVVETMKRVLGEEHERTLHSMANLAVTYFDQGRWKEAEELLVQTTEARKRVLGEENPETLASMANLASTYHWQGRWKEAEELEVRVMKTKIRILGEDHPATLRSIGNLAETYRKQGKLEEAVELKMQALETRVKVLGVERPEQLKEINDLASVLSDRGEYENAEETYRAALEIYKTVLGEEHPNTLDTMNNVAKMLSGQDKYRDAEDIYRQVLAIHKTVRGEDDPKTLASMNNVADILSRQRKDEEAESLHRETLALRETVLGKEHPDTLTSINNLAAVLKDQGKDEEAENLHRQALTLRERVLGKEHPDTLTSMNDLATVLSRQGKHEEAENLHRQALALEEKVLGKIHPSTLASRLNLARVLSRQGHNEEAEYLLRQALALCEELGKELPFTPMKFVLGTLTLEITNALVMVLSNQGKDEETAQILRQALALYEELGKEHPATLEITKALVIVLSRQGKDEEAEHVLRQARPNTPTSMNNLVVLLSRQGKHEEAERILRQARPSTPNSMKNLAGVLNNQGKFEEAEPILRQALTLCEELGREHPLTQEITKGLEVVSRNQRMRGEADHLHQHASHRVVPKVEGVKRGWPRRFLKRVFRR
ncbi:MAG: hypothetical protein LQ338_005248 [Usnochroma carphineum]|nr:MAG: hypothetical protein LQ338_005248 [Usnochroma carphineum]